MMNDIATTVELPKPSVLTARQTELDRAHDIV